MAKRRMFSKDIVCSDKFRTLSLSSQALYFHLGMEADDRGYVDNPITLMRCIGANQGDLEPLLQKKFVLLRGDGLLLIKGWRINNYIQKDRFIESNYKEDLKTLFLDENGSYTEHQTENPCIQIGYNMDTQDSIGKDSIDKYSVGNKERKEDELNKSACERTQEEIDEIVKIAKTRWVEDNKDE